MWVDEDLATIRTANELRSKGLSLRRAFRIAPAVAELRGWAVIAPDQWFPAHTPEQVVERLERLKVPVVIVRVG